MKNIVLFGFMGTGKSLIGEILSQKLNYPLIEMDQEIENNEGLTISKIFEEKGESYFRSLELELSEKISNSSSKIISTGGGIILNDKNIVNLSKNSLCVCLNANPSTIFNRICNDKNRPLLDSDDNQIEEKFEKILKLLNDRKLLYKKIPFQIDTDELDPYLISDMIISEYKK